MSSEIDFLLDEIRKECELGNIERVIILSDKLKKITLKLTCDHVFEAVPKNGNHLYVDFKAQCIKCGYSPSDKPIDVGFSIKQQQKQAKEQ